VNLYGMVGNAAVNLWDYLGLAGGCGCIVVSVTPGSIRLSDSMAGETAADLSAKVFKWARKKHADQVASVNHGYTWKVQVETKKLKRGGDPSNENDYTAMPTHVMSGDIDSAFIYSTHAEAASEAENHRKDARDEAMMVCKDSK
jgi:hypothetical protein